MFETKTWLTKAFNRKLVGEDQFVSLMAKLDEIGKMINGYIGSIGDVNEPFVIYETNNEGHPNI